MNILRTLTAVLLAWAASGIAQAQKWQPLKNTVPANAGAMELLTDGTVMLHSEQDDSQNWYRLTPDNAGSYVNGTWQHMASMPGGYAPLFFASAVLPDGRLIVEGGLYNNLQADWTNLGAIYDPVANEWTSVKPGNMRCNETP